MYCTFVYFWLFHHKMFSLFQLDMVYVIYFFRVIPSVLVWLCWNCPLDFKLRSYVAFLQKQPLEVFCKKSAFGGFSGFVGGRLCWGLFLIKLQTWWPVKGDPSMGVFLFIIQILRAPILKNICIGQFLFF